MGHSRLRRHRVLTSHALLLLMHVLLVGHLLLLLRGDSIIGVHCGVAPRHGGLLSRNLGVADILGRVHCGFPIHPVLGAGCGLGRIQTGLSGTALAGA